MAEYEADCQTCEWREPMPTRAMAEHAKRVHEEWYNHSVVLEQYP